jgi:hypothetical protein
MPRRDRYRRPRRPLDRDCAARPWRCAGHAIRPAQPGPFPASSIVRMVSGLRAPLSHTGPDDLATELNPPGIVAGGKHRPQYRSDGVFRGSEPIGIAADNDKLAVASLALLAPLAEPACAYTRSGRPRDSRRSLLAARRRFCDGIPRWPTAFEMTLYCLVVAPDSPTGYARSVGQGSSWNRS